MVISASIKALIAGEQVSGSKISNKLLEELLAEGLILVVAHGCRKSYRARDVIALKRYLIDKDENYRILEVGASDSRASIAAETGNSKLAIVRSCPGFPVNSYEPIECRLNGEPFLVNPQKGYFFFVTEWNHFSIPEDVIVIGIENMENFRLIRQQRSFFETYLKTRRLPTKVLFVSRYPQSVDLRKWLMSIPNHYLHFGDFDLAGIKIFLSEFQEFIGSERSSYLIPDDIETRLKSGSRKRYDEQLCHFNQLQSNNSELQRLINLIHNERKAYDQEGYICNSILFT